MILGQFSSLETYQTVFKHTRDQLRVPNTFGTTIQQQKTSNDSFLVNFGTNWMEIGANRTTSSPFNSLGHPGRKQIWPWTTRCTMKGWSRKREIFEKHAIRAPIRGTKLRSHTELSKSYSILQRTIYNPGISQKGHSYYLHLMESREFEERVL